MTEQQKNSGGARQGLSEKTKRIILVSLMVLLVFLVLRQYMPMIELPTNSNIEDKLLQLKSLQDDLAVQRKVSEDWQAKVEEIRGKSGQFWMRTRPTLPVEQEVLEEFNGLARLASVNIQSKEARLIKTANVTFIQEVELRMEMRSVSMREFTRLLREVEGSRRKFYWASCKIDPDNVQKPTGIKVSARLKAFVLSEDAMKILGGDVSQNDIKDISARGKSGKGNARNTRGSSSSVRRTGNGSTRGGSAR